MVNDDIHDQLTKAYMEYFKENDKFEQRNSVRTHTASRKWLREIRMEEIRKKHVTTRKTKTKGSVEQAHIYTFMQWTYNGKKITKIPDEYEGFVYLITNNTTGQKYIGKKLAKFKTTKPPLKGKKNKRRGTKESDWQTYWGSSDRLNADVAQLGEDKFTREILYLCKGRGEMSYIEAREQFDRRVLETDDYYNGIINVRVGGSDKLKQALLEQNIKAKQSNT